MNTEGKRVMRFPSGQFHFEDAYCPSVTESSATMCELNGCTPADPLDPAVQAWIDEQKGREG